MVPGLTDFIIFKVNNRAVDVDLYRLKLKKLVVGIFQKYLEDLQSIMIDAVKTQPCFRPMGRFSDLQRLIKGYLGYGNKMGEVGSSPPKCWSLSTQHEQHRLHAALRLPAEPHRRQGHDPRFERQLSRFQHRSHRLRPRRDENQPGKPHQAHDFKRGPAFRTRLCPIKRTAHGG